MTNFNFIAPAYDGLVRVVFGSKLWKTQKTHLHLIQPDDRVLILGGGTGRILDWIPSCEVTYLELSLAMIKRAKQRGHANFIHADFLKWESDEVFDWIICPFFLDCFVESELIKCLNKMDKMLSEQGQVVVSDFKVGKARHQLLVTSMMLFFRLTAGLKAKKLLDLTSILKTYFKPMKQASFLNGLVFSDLYSAQIK